MDLYCQSVALFMTAYLIKKLYIHLYFLLCIFRIIQFWLKLGIRYK